MPIVAKNKKGDYSTAPEGLWPAVCVDVVDLGLVEDQWGERYRIELRWVLDEQDPGIDPKSGKPYMIVQKYTNSLHEKSRLRPMLEAWRGRKFTNDELDGFDLEKLIGANCQLQIIHNLGKEGGTFANVQACVPAAKNTTKLRVPQDYIRVCDRDKKPENGNGYKASDDDLAF